MRDSIQIGDEITTIGGIVGRVVTIKEEQDEPKQKMIGNKSVTSRCLGAGVGLLKSFLIVVLICAPITGLISIVDTVDEVVDIDTSTTA